MADLEQLRTASREIFDAAIRTVDPGDAVRKAVRLEGLNLAVQDREIQLRSRPIYAIALGKAAIPMAIALEARLGTHFCKGVISGPHFFGCAVPADRWQRFDGGHPLPSEESLRAAAAAFALLDQANTEQAQLIFLISGGGSAMLEWPVTDNISLADLRTANKMLVNCGASISEINSVRRVLSAVKGGKLGARAPNCEQVTLIVSDVPKGEEHSVASGPSASVPNDAPEPSDVIERYRLKDQLPPSIVRAVEAAATAPTPTHMPNEPLVLLDNGSAREAARRAAEDRGFITAIANGITDQPIEEGSQLLLDRLAALRAKHQGAQKPICLISGGEFSCPVRGDGVGGRNLETALRLALTAETNRHCVGDFVALCAGTDGIDGNSTAAGAVVDNTAIDRARQIGLDAQDFLRRSDSYSFFQALGDTIITGPTGTNVRDIRLLLSQT